MGGIIHESVSRYKIYVFLFHCLFLLDNAPWTCFSNLLFSPLLIIVFVFCWLHVTMIGLNIPKKLPHSCWIAFVLCNYRIFKIILFSWSNQIHHFVSSESISFRYSGTLISTHFPSILFVSNLVCQITLV